MCVGMVVTPTQGAPMNDTTTERKYAMIRVRAGLYLLPSNDLQTIWRLSSYEEHGDAQWQDDSGQWHTIRGTVWEVARMSLATMQRLADDPYTSDDDLLWSDEWASSESCLPSRKAAIKAALS